eukprot:CAMPEP_0175070884 /NCGR_PEP_ID=MMETSP0052_2-20121109/18948_1 /TAXON_ID=51329 ORGANISM="Polytomella parva, Strain SAG 63-3" /NCGR_SAMPLE_ID=MMETSP0052_2 /ASSEMBLY_ACC=CAM_ASM_000194 /LENGTH=219 /DNA_ID=CAMNT_0016338019 /DNA_START=112 /DNA_END=770 /DNA_ORIENTATION=-
MVVGVSGAAQHAGGTMGFRDVQGPGAGRVMGVPERGGGSTRIQGGKATRRVVRGRVPGMARGGGLERPGIEHVMALTGGRWRFGWHVGRKGGIERMVAGRGAGGFRRSRSYVADFKAAAGCWDGEKEEVGNRELETWSGGEREGDVEGGEGLESGAKLTDAIGGAASAFPSTKQTSKEDFEGSTPLSMSSIFSTAAIFCRLKLGKTTKSSFRFKETIFE